LHRVSSFIRLVLHHPSSFENRVRALRRFLFRQMRKRVTSRPLIIQWEGMLLEVGMHARAAAAAYYLGRPDWWEFDFIERFVRPGDVAVDVGANVGVYSLFLAQRVGPSGSIIACEPDPDNAAALAANLARNHLQQVHVVQAAIADREGRVPFAAGRHTMSRIAENSAVATCRVPVTTLDTLCAGTRPLFAKVDVEGAEHLVLRGARALMAAGAPPVWQLEIDPDRREQTTHLAHELAASGYRTYAWDAESRTLRTRRVDEPCGKNLLAIADRSVVERRLGSPCA
jgi:FkbM family methyltransferase